MKKILYILAAFAVLALMTSPVNAARYEQLSVTQLTVADVNASDDVTIADDASVGGTLDVTGVVTMGAEPVTTSGNGAVNGTGVSAVENGNGILHKTVITCADLTVSLTDEANVVAYLGQKIYDFPEGAIMIVGSTSDLAITLSAAGVDATWNGDFGLGTATAGNDANLTSTEDDILPTTATPAASSSATTATGQSTAAENVVHDGTGTAKDMYLNVLVDDGEQDVTTTATDMIFNGTITVLWYNLGDY